MRPSVEMVQLLGSQGFWQQQVLRGVGSCWSFNGLERGGSESKREKEADIPWFMRKANRALFLGLTLLHVGTRRPLEWVKAQWTFSRGS